MALVFPRVIFRLSVASTALSIGEDDLEGYHHQTAVLKFVRKSIKDSSLSALFLVLHFISYAVCFFVLDISDRLSNGRR